jgi:hypothetical protein
MKSHLLIKCQILKLKVQGKSKFQISNIFISESFDLELF